MMARDEIAEPDEPRLAPAEERIERFDADLDVGGAPCAVTVLLTTRRLILLPTRSPAEPSPYQLACPLSITLAGLGVADEFCEVSLLSESGLARLQFATRRAALAFTFSVRGAVHFLA